MEIVLKEYKNNENYIDLTIINNEINGIYSTDPNRLSNIFKFHNESRGQIIIDGKEIKRQNINIINSKISIIDKKSLDDNQTTTIKKLFENTIKQYKVELKDEQKKILDSLKIVGLDQELINRPVYTLSTYEKKAISFAKALITNPEVIILVNYFKGLDKNNEKRLIMLIQKIKEQYNKTFIIISDNSEILYKYTRNIIVFKNDKVIIEGNTDAIFQRVEFLKKHKIDIPKIVEFTFIAKKYKKVKIDYHKDVRDIIKDIYKHV